MICRRNITLWETLGLKGQVNAEDFSAVNHPVSSDEERQWLSLCKLLQSRVSSSTEGREGFYDIKDVYQCFLPYSCTVKKLMLNSNFGVLFQCSLCSSCSLCFWAVFAGRHLSLGRDHSSWKPNLNAPGYLEITQAKGMKCPCISTREGLQHQCSPSMAASPVLRSQNG